MPISRRQFDMGIGKETDDWMTKIHQFLREHKDEAYNTDEILERFNAKDVFNKYRKTDDIDIPVIFSLSEHVNKEELTNYQDNPFVIAINTLVESGAISKKKIQDINYYAYNKPLDG